MTLDLGVLQRNVLRYVEGRIKLPTFERWFVPWAWDCSATDVPAQRILGLLAAADELTEEDLKEKMLDAVSLTRSVGKTRLRPKQLRLSGLPPGRKQPEFQGLALPRKTVGVA
jgi:hypothetical protein